MPDVNTETPRDLETPNLGSPIKENPKQWSRQMLNQQENLKVSLEGS